VMEGSVLIWILAVLLGCAVHLRGSVVVPSPKGFPGTEILENTSFQDVAEGRFSILFKPVFIFNKPIKVNKEFSGGIFRSYGT
jgi:hypothetical protein